jgi:hypothetical protein
MVPRTRPKSRLVRCRDESSIFSDCLHGTLLSQERPIIPEGAGRRQNGARTPAPWPLRRRGYNGGQNRQGERPARDGAPVAVIDNAIDPAVYKPVDHWRTWLDVRGFCRPRREPARPPPGLTHLILTGPASIASANRSNVRRNSSAKRPAAAWPSWSVGAPTHRLRAGRPRSRPVLPPAGDGVAAHPGFRR